MNSIEKLVMMANQIAANQQHDSDPAEATANHIKLYWDPRMKRLLTQHGTDGLTPTAAAALALITA